MPHINTVFFHLKGTTEYEFVTDNMPYTTLMFTTGDGANFTVNEGEVCPFCVVKS